MSRRSSTPLHNFYACGAIGGPNRIGSVPAFSTFSGYIALQGDHGSASFRDIKPIAATAKK
jgi:hypothetical protein